MQNFKNEDLDKTLNNFAHSFKENVKNRIHSCDIKTFANIYSTIPNSMYINYADEQEIYNIINSLNSKKGAGADGIRPKDLKNNAIYIAPVLTHLVNSSLNNGIVPDLLKTSVIRPIFKSGSKTDCNNYRPIAILPVVEKILEEIVVKRLTTFIEKYKLINGNQFGFQKGKSINKLLGNFCNHINSSLSKNMHCLVLYVDFSKAFDTLTHANLIQTLERIGIRGITLSWFKSYLECRSYQVKIQNKYSEKVLTDCGVPQGSKLGPILYIIYANDMLNALSGNTAYAYADDTAVVVTDKNIKFAIKLIQDQLNIITRWCHDNGLIINASKTKIMHIKPRHLAHQAINITYHNYDCLHNKATNPLTTNESCDTVIELVDSYKYLGVYVDSSFKWKLHVENLQKKLRKSAYMLRHLSYCSTYNVIRQAYFSLVESYLRHGIAAWGSSSHCRTIQKMQDQILKILQKQQNRNYTQVDKNFNNSNSLQSRHQHNMQALQTTTSQHNQHIQQQTTTINATLISNQHKISKTESLTKTLNILNVKNIYYLTLINEFYNDSRFFKVIDHNYNTRRRNEGRFKVERFYNEYGRHTLEVTLPSVFNKIPTQIIKLNNVYKRKKEFKNYFLSSQ